MTYTPNANDSSWSPTYEWKRVKMRRPAGGQRESPPKAVRFWHLPQWPARRPLTIKIKYRGGAQGWIEVHARGSIARYSGDTPILEVWCEITRN